MRAFTRIKNYTTDVPVERTITEIEKMLAAHGASKILKEYDHRGAPSGMSFIVPTPRGPMPVKMPVRVERVAATFKVQVGLKRLERRYWGGAWADAQAARVAWRIARDWLDAQLAMIEAEMTNVAEIFLPYVYNEKLGQTVYEMFDQGKLPLLKDVEEDERSN